MSDLSLQDIRDFNHCLKTLHAAGVSLNFDATPNSAAAGATLDCATRQSLADSLLALEATIANALSSGTPPGLALAQSCLVPNNYRQSLLLWQQNDRLPFALEPITVAAQAQRREWGRHAVNLVQPMVAIVLAFCCLAFICAFVAPLFEMLRQQTRATPGPFLTALLWLRAWMPVWLWAIPVGIFVFTIQPLLRWKNATRLPPFTNSQRNWMAEADMAGQAQVAAFADQLITSGLSPAQTVQWVQSTICWHPPAVSPTVPSEKTPALMAWAINAPQTDTTNSTTGSRLRMAAAIYGACAEAMASRGRNFIQPRIEFILFGGLLVLAVSVLVFGPLIEMLLFISLSNSSLIQ